MNPLLQEVLSITAAQSVSQKKRKKEKKKEEQTIQLLLLQPAAPWSTPPLILNSPATVS